MRKLIPVLLLAASVAFASDKPTVPLSELAKAQLATLRAKLETIAVRKDVLEGDTRRVQGEFEALAQRAATDLKVDVGKYKLDPQQEAFVLQTTTTTTSTTSTTTVP